MKSEKSYLSANIKKLKNSEVEIEVEINSEQLVMDRQTVLKEMTKDVEIPGFRKGQAPEKLIVEKLGEMYILKEAAELSISRAYEEIIKDKKIDAIGRPEVVITKLAPNNNLCFKIKTATVPEISMGDYVKVAKKIVFDKESGEVTEKEIEDVLTQISNPEQGAESKDDSVKNKSLPLTDDFAKSLGFKDLGDLKQKIKDDLKQQKLIKAKGKRRMSIIEEITKNTVIELPQILIESELRKMMAEFQDRVENSGLSFKDYLTNTKTTEEKIRKEWEPQAEKKAKIQLVLNKIAEEQSIVADPKKLESEIKLVLEQYPKANKESATIFIETILKNEAVFEFLEKLSA